MYISCWTEAHCQSYRNPHLLHHLYRPFCFLHAPKQLCQSEKYIPISSLESTHTYIKSLHSDLVFGKIFVENCMKRKIIGPRGDRIGDRSVDPPRIKSYHFHDLLWNPRYLSHHHVHVVAFEDVTLLPELRLHLLLPCTSHVGRNS